MTIFFSVTIYRFLLLSSGIIYGYYTYVLKIDEEDFGGHGALLQEGLFASFSLFLVYFLDLAFVISIQESQLHPLLGFHVIVLRWPQFMRQLDCAGQPFLAS